MWSEINAYAKARFDIGRTLMLAQKNRFSSPFFHRFDFKTMRDEYSNSKYFPPGIDFKEPKAPADFKDYMFKIYPESARNVHQRGVALFEQINERI